MSLNRIGKTLKDNHPSPIDRYTPPCQERPSLRERTSRACVSAACSGVQPRSEKRKGFFFLEGSYKETNNRAAISSAASGKVSTSWCKCSRVSITSPERNCPQCPSVPQVRKSSHKWICMSKMSHDQSVEGRFDNKNGKLKRTPRIRSFFSLHAGGGARTRTTVTRHRILNPIEPFDYIGHFVNNYP